jgi:hypothetical protein
MKSCAPKHQPRRIRSALGSLVRPGAAPILQQISTGIFTPITTANQMIDSSLVLDSQLARHRQLFDPIIN